MVHVLLTSTINPFDAPEKLQRLELDSNSASPSNPRCFGNSNIFVCKDSLFVCVHLNSDKNTTFLNQVDIVPGSVVGLHKGDVLYFGQHSLWCVYDTMPMINPAPASAPPLAPAPPAPSPMQEFVLTPSPQYLEFPLTPMLNFDLNGIDLADLQTHVNMNYLKTGCSSVEEFVFIVDSIKNSTPHMYQLDPASMQFIDFLIKRLGGCTEKLACIIEHYGSTSKFVTETEKLITKSTEISQDPPKRDRDTTKKRRRN